MIETTNLTHRLHSYRRSARAFTPATAAIAAAATWTVITPDKAEADVTFVNGVLTSPGYFGPPSQNNAFYFNGSASVAPNYLLGDSTFGIAVSYGPAAVGTAMVSLNAPIGSGSSSIYFASAPKLRVLTPGGFLPLRVTTEAGYLYGWAQLGSLNFGISNVGGTPVFAGGNFAPAAVPEATTALPLLVLGAVGMARIRKRRQQAA